MNSGEGDSHKHEADRHRYTLGVGVEEFFHEVEEYTHTATQKERSNYLNNRCNNYGINVYVSKLDCIGNTEGNCKDYKTNRIVQSNYRKEHLGNRALCLVLLNYHKGCRRCGSRCDSTENNCRLNGEHAGDNKVESDKRCVNDQGGDNSLENTDYCGLVTNLL